MSAREELVTLLMVERDRSPRHYRDLSSDDLADAILASDWLAKHDAEVGERIAKAIEAEGLDSMSTSDVLEIVARATTTTEVGNG